MSLSTKCTFYKNVIDKPFKGGPLSTPGRLVSMIDLLTNERYTNGNLLISIRNSGYKSQFYESHKKNLSAACFSSVQDDLSRDRSDANHLFHTGYIAFDIDPPANPYLMIDGEGLRDFMIENIPYIAYLGKSVSNLGYWGLFPILNKDDHTGHYQAMKDLFSGHNIVVDNVQDISRLRFLAYDPDGYINDAAKTFCSSVIHHDQTMTINEYERADITDELFIGACRWVELKHKIRFQKGSIHNYLLYLYSTLRACHVPRYKILNWVYNNLIEEDKVTTNCLQEIKRNK